MCGITLNCFGHRIATKKKNCLGEILKSQSIHTRLYISINTFYKFITIYIITLMVKVKAPLADSMKKTFFIKKKKNSRNIFFFSSIAYLVAYLHHNSEESTKYNFQICLC